MLNGSRRNERGSILIACLGLLVLMALLATSFLANVNMQRDAAANYHRGMVAEMTALAGQANAQRVLSDYANNSPAPTYCGYDQGWSTAFQGSVGTNFTLTDMWRHAGIADNTSSEYCGNNLASQWLILGDYTKNLDGISNACTGGVDSSSAAYDLLFPIRARYAVSIIDLSGCLPMNPYSGVTSATWGDFVGNIMNKANSSITAAHLSTVYQQTSAFASGVPNLSWYFINGSYHVTATAVLSSSDLFMLTPFSDNYSGYAGVGVALNVNTAPQKLLEALASAKLASSGKTILGPMTAAAWAAAVVTQRKTAHFEPGDPNFTITMPGYSTTEPDTAISEMVYDGTGTTKTILNTAAVSTAGPGILHAAPSHFFRVSVRGQLVNKLTDEIEGERNIEFVMYVNLSKWQVLYQKTVDNSP